MIDQNITIIQPFQRDMELFPIIRSKTPAQQNGNIPLPKGQVGTAWELSKPEIKITIPVPPPFRLNVVSLTTSPTISYLSLQF
jgi:hypothetical protein